MDIWAADKLVLVLGFVIPGFLCLKTYQALGLKTQKDSSQQLIDALAFSCINYALLAWPIMVVEASALRSSSPSLYMAFYGFVILVAPVAWGMLWMWMRKTKLMQQMLPHPMDKPWDYFFSMRKSHWVIVTLTDGRQVGGKFSSKSFASAAPAPEQIYLEEAWEVNGGGGLERARIESAGLLIMGNKISTLEFFQLHGEARGNERHSEDPGHKRLAANHTESTAAGECVRRLSAQHQQDAGAAASEEAISDMRQN